MRHLAALALVSLLVVACGSSTATGSPGAAGSAVPGASSAPGSPDASGAVASSTPGSSTAAGSTPAPGGSAAPAGSASSADCAKLNDAIGTVDLYTQLLSQVDASNWTDLTGPASPVGFSVAKFDAAVATLATFPDANGLSKNLKQIELLLAIAMKDPAPFATSSRAGVQLTDAVQKLFVPVGVAMTQVREGLGCPVQ